MDSALSPGNDSTVLWSKMSRDEDVEGSGLLPEKPGEERRDEERIQPAAGSRNPSHRTWSLGCTCCDFADAVHPGSPG